MKRPMQISPSILSADFLNLEKDVALLASTSPAPEWLHVDVMDGHFVPNLTIGPPFVRALAKAFPSLPLDVHLMIDNPKTQLNWYLEAGAKLLTIHLETASQDNVLRQNLTALAPGSSKTITELSPEDAAKIKNLLEDIRSSGCLAGISLNPDTPVALLQPLLGSFDLVLIMSVHPGFGGQSFIQNALEKIAELNSWRSPTKVANPEFLIEVDGGINKKTAPLAYAAGADILVAGNAIFAAPSPVLAYKELREASNLPPKALV